jgi:hypothetical protein
MTVFAKKARERVAGGAPHLAFTDPRIALGSRQPDRTGHASSLREAPDFETLEAHIRRLEAEGPAAVDWMEVARLTVSDGVAVKGGAGGSFTTGGGNGVGGVGISGSGLTLTLGAASTVIGGLGGDGTTRANAIAFTAGTNVLELVGNGAASGQTRRRG